MNRHGRQRANREQRQNATWPNDRKLASAPLDASHPTGGGGGGGNSQGCGKCGGDKHGHFVCPNEKAKTDKGWQRKPDAAKKKPCGKCGGVGHWSYHHDKADPGSRQRSAKAETNSNQRQAATK